MSTYFKNTELAARYNISEATVRNWIKQSKEGKIPFELIKRDNKFYVANCISNISIIESLIKQNRKYRNKLSMKTVRPEADLFKIFNEAQVYDIARNLELHHEIPLQYSYFGVGANIWDEYVEKQLKAGTPNVLMRTIELLADNYSYIDSRLIGIKKVNVIDIGVGNAEPVKGLVGHLLGQGKLNRYVALDFSEDMLNLARRNLHEYFEGRVNIETYSLDISYERFPNIFAEDYLRPEQDVLNLVLFLGSTPNNLRAPSDAFRTICESMNPGDLFIYTGKLAPKNALPEWFEHEFKRNNLERPELARQDRLVLDLLGIKESYYDIEIGFDEDQGLRYARTKFRVAVKILLNFGQGERALTFEKGDSILLWRAWRTTPRSLMIMFEDTGFYLLHTSQSQDHNYILTIAEVKRTA